MVGQCLCERHNAQKNSAVGAQMIIGGSSAAAAGFWLGRECVPMFLLIFALVANLK
jgi:hypothetical protein